MVTTPWEDCWQDAEMVREAADSLLAGISSGRHDVVSSDGLGPGWKSLFDGGYLFAPTPPGDGATLAEALAIVEQAGRHVVRGPVAESGILATWLLEMVGLPVPAGPMTFALAPDVEIVGDALTGTVRRVPWAQDVERIVFVLTSPEGPLVASVDPSGATIDEGRNLAGERRDTVALDRTAAAVAERPLPFTTDELLARAALTRASLMSGAAARAVELTIRYTNERLQFGRPISRFQPVQAHVVRAAEHVRAAQVASRSAALAMTFRPLDCLVEAASAKIVSSRAAGLVAASTHQATGAIGMTKEYELGHLTTRLWSWREENGSESYWARRLGERVRAAGPDALWSIIADDSAVTR